MPRPENRSNPAALSGRPLRWLVGVAYAAALVAAFLLSSQVYFSMLDHGHEWWRIMLWQSILWGFWASVSPWVLQSGVALFGPRERPRWWLGRLLALGAALLVAHQIVGALALLVIQPYVPVATYSYVQALGRTWNAWAGVSPVVFGTMVATGYGVGGYWAARRRELHESRLEAELARAQLHALRLEIQPHFLFNTLNSIAGLVRREDNEQALEMLLKLSELLRSTLEHSGGPLVPLEEEVDFVRRYLELQTIRFADRLEVKYAIPDECLSLEVPFLILQPLAENALKHGLSRSEGPGSVEIAATCSGDDLVLTVADNGEGLAENFDLDSQSGVGLSNARSRLLKTYRDRATVDIRNRPERGVVATVVIPQKAQNASLVRVSESRA